MSVGRSVRPSPTSSEHATYGNRPCLNFLRLLRFQKKVFITKSTAAKLFAFTHFARYMKYEIGEDASFVLVAFLFNSDILRIAFAKLKKKNALWMDRQMDGWTDGQTEG